MSSHALAAPKPAGVGLPDGQKAGTSAMFRLISTCLTKNWAAVVIPICIIYLCHVHRVAGPHFWNSQGGNSRCWYVPPPHRMGARVHNSSYLFFSHTAPLLCCITSDKVTLHLDLLRSFEQAVKTYLPSGGQEIFADHKDCICIASILSANIET